MSVIVYKQGNGVVAIIRPTEEALEAYGIAAIAKKDVPYGFPYKILAADDIPTDRSTRNAWVIDDSELTDGVGGELSVFDQALTLAEDETPLIEPLETNG